MKAEPRNAIVRGGRGLVGIEERSDLGLFDRGGNLDLVLSVENRETWEKTAREEKRSHFFEES